MFLKELNENFAINKLKVDFFKKLLRNKVEYTASRCRKTTTNFCIFSVVLCRIMKK